MRAVDKNPWFLALISFVVGLHIAFKGRNKFPTASMVMAIFVGTKTTVYVGAELGYMDDLKDGVIVGIVAVLIGILAGYIVRKSIKTGVVFTGIVAGAAIGALYFGLCLAIFGESEAMQSVRTFYLSLLVFGLLGAFLGFRKGKEVVLYGTSLAGAFIFL